MLWLKQKFTAPPFRQSLLNGGLWLSDQTRSISRSFITANGGTTLLNASTGYINPAVSFSRANQAMVCDQYGNWTWTSLPYRRSYDMVTKEWGYLFEPQRTNLLYGPLSPSAATVVADRLVGDLQSYVVRPDTSNAIHRVNFTTITPTAGVTITASVFVESLGTRYVYINGWGSSNSGQVCFDLQDGTYTAGSSAGGAIVSASAIRVGNYWRLVVVHTPNSTAQGSSFLQLNNAYIGTDTTYVGDPTTQGIRVWGMQIETGSVATSPIATNGAQVTVAADVCTWSNAILTETSGTVLARVNVLDAQSNRSILSTNAFDTTTFWLGYQYGPNPIARGGVGTGAGAELFGTPANATLLMSYSGTARTLLSNTQAEVAGTCSSNTMPNPLTICGGNTAGYINHLSVFPTQLTAPKRATAASFTKF